jgi:hypothetical protein
MQATAQAPPRSRGGASFLAGSGACPMQHNTIAAAPGTV